MAALSPDLVPPAPGLRERRADLVAAIVLAFAAAVFICQIVWPGFMSFDTLFSYRQSIEGIVTAVRPPMHDYLFFIFRHLPGSPGNFLFFQCFILFLSCNLIIRHFSPSAGISIPLMMVFFGLFFVFPAMAGTLIALWRDAAFASFAALAAALWLSGLRRFSWLKLAFVFLSLTVAIALRYNAISMLLPFLLLMLLLPGRNARTARHRAGVGAGIVLTLLLSYSTSLWRLPDLARLPPVGGMVTMVQLWDLAGISACAGENVFPADEGSTEEPLTVELLREIYDPRNINLTFQDPAVAARLAAYYMPDMQLAVQKRWQALLTSQTGCYLQTRFAVFRELMGLNTPTIFYPAHGGIDDNPYGFRLSYPERAQSLIMFILESSQHPLRRGYVLISLSVLALLPLIWLDRWRSALPAALVVGSVGSIALLAVAAPAADARYIFPSSVFAALVLMIAIARIAARLPRVSR